MTPFNPLDYRNLSESIARAMLARPVSPLAALFTPIRFEGAGLYALYYTGPFPAYARLAERNRDDRWAWPIYVGKADKKPVELVMGQRTYALYNRLLEHKKSIAAAPNLDLSDVHYRYLIVEDPFIALGETRLINELKPLWNSPVLSGFGSKATGGPRSGQERSLWDTVHGEQDVAGAWRGRRGAGQAPNPRSRDDILSGARRFIEDALAGIHVEVLPQDA